MGGAPLAHLRSYLVSRSDIMLSPPGDLPWLRPSWQPLLRMSRAMAERQFRGEPWPAKTVRAASSRETPTLAAGSRSYHS